MTNVPINAQIAISYIGYQTIILTANSKKLALVTLRAVSYTHLKRITSAFDLPRGEQSEPPLPPPIGRVVSEFLNVCSKARNFKIPKFTAVSYTHLDVYKRQPIQ